MVSGTSSVGGSPYHNPGAWTMHRRALRDSALCEIVTERNPGGMMRTRKLAAMLIAIAVLFGVAACATGTGVAADRHDVTIIIDNNLSRIAGISAYLVTETSARRSLGPVESNEKGTFDRSLPTGTYYLIATRVSNPDLISERFRIDTDSVVVVWNMASNQIAFGKK